MNESTPQDNTISGRAVVIAMFALAITATGILWAYWNLHLMPFMPLQEALAEEYEESSPRVDGGRRKTHKGTPLILRVVMRVPFDPNSSAADVQDLIEERLTRTQEMAAKLTVDFESYEVLQVHLYQEEKEGQMSQKTFERELLAGVSEPRIDANARE